MSDSDFDFDYTDWDALRRAYELTQGPVEERPILELCDYDIVGHDGALQWGLSVIYDADLISSEEYYRTPHRVLAPDRVRRLPPRVRYFAITDGPLRGVFLCHTFIFGLDLISIVADTPAARQSNKLVTYPRSPPLRTRFPSAVASTRTTKPGPISTAHRALTASYTPQGTLLSNWTGLDMLCRLKRHSGRNPRGKVYPPGRRTTPPRRTTSTARTRTRTQTRTRPSSPTPAPPAAPLRLRPRAQHAKEMLFRTRLHSRRRLASS